MTGTASYKLLQGDCLDILPSLADGSVDAVVTDPPYGQSNEAYDRGVNPAVWQECFRVCRPNAAILSFAGSPTYHRIATQIEAAGWKVRQMWAWIYRDGLITSAWPKEGFDRLAPAMDPICFATKGKVLLSVGREGETSWDRLTGRTDPYARIGLSDRSGHMRKRQGQGHYSRTVVADKEMDGLQYFVLSRGADRSGQSHPNQKPLSLMKWLLDKLPAGATILDPFMGSGSTGLACFQTGRHFIGIEKEPAYHAIAERRLAEAQAEAANLLPLEATP